MSCLGPDSLACSVASVVADVVFPIETVSVPHLQILALNYSGFVQILYNEITVLSRTFQALFWGFSRTTIRDLIYQTYFIYFKLILIKATYVIQSRAASDFLFCSLININETDSSGFIRRLSL